MKFRKNKGLNVSINEFYTYCSSCGKKFNIITSGVIKVSQRFCSTECANGFHVELEKLQRKRTTEMAKKHIADTYKKIKEPADRDKLVSLEKFFDQKRRTAITASMTAEGYIPKKSSYQKRRSDGMLKTYKSNAYTLGEIYDAVQSKQKKYKETASMSFRNSRDYLVDVYRVVKDRA